MAQLLKNSRAALLLEPAFIQEIFAAGAPEVEELDGGMVRLVFWTTPAAPTLEGERRDHRIVAGKVVLSRKSYETMCAGDDELRPQGHSAASST